LSSRTTEFRLLTLAAICAALLPRLAHRGMFFDGITFASIARNLAEGRGRFWEPSYTATIYPAFYDHPPLGFWLQSLWFRALGDHWFVERLYSLTAGVIIGLLIVFTWRSLYDADASDARDYEWLPVAFWIAVPVVSWTIVGNLLETTVAVFVAAAGAAVVAGTRHSVGVAIAGGAVSGLCIVGAVLVKGPVGLFPLAAPVILALLPERRRMLPWCTGAQWAAVGACAVILLTTPASHESLTRYFNQQVMAALAGRREVSGSSFTIVVELLQGVWLPIAIVAAITIAGARAWSRPSAHDRRIALAFTLIGLAGTLPILASPKQSGHYLMPAVPFYAIAAGALMMPTVSGLARRMSGTRAALAVKVVAVMLALGAFAAMPLRVLERDPQRLAALDGLAPFAPRGATVGICAAANSDWVLHAWLQRRFAMSLDASGAPHDWFLESGGATPGCPPATCAPVSDTAAGLVLLRCRTSP
jgi:4-amino-4-deoxy-L-arabinose transferase-like glycosyltransferase